MNPRHMTDGAIAYTIGDINAAIAANPENPKVFMYLAQRESLKQESATRERKRLLRRNVSLGTDPLTLTYAWQRRQARKLSEYHATQRWNAAFSLGWIRLQGGAQ